jgi:hypothetical protein
MVYLYRIDIHRKEPVHCGLPVAQRQTDGPQPPFITVTAITAAVAINPEQAKAKRIIILMR